MSNNEAQTPAAKRPGSGKVARSKREFSFGSYHRLQKQQDFAAVRKAGGKLNDKFLVINYLARGDTKATRIGIITTRRLGKATRRNRLRRLVREAVRHTLRDLKRGFDIVVVVRVAAKAGDLVGFGLSFRQLALEAGLLKDESSPNHR